MGIRAREAWKSRAAARAFVERKWGPGRYLIAQRAWEQAHAAAVDAGRARSLSRNAKGAMSDLRFVGEIESSLGRLGNWIRREGTGEMKRRFDVAVSHWSKFARYMESARSQIADFERDALAELEVLRERSRLPRLPRLASLDDRMDGLRPSVIAATLRADPDFPMSPSEWAYWAIAEGLEPCAASGDEFRELSRLRWQVAKRRALKDRRAEDR